MNFAAPMKEGRAAPRVTKSILTPFGVELRKLRVEHGLRLYDLALGIDVSPSYISAIETGRRPISPEVIDAISAHFHLSEFEIAKLRQAAELSRSEVVLRPASQDYRDFANEAEKKINSLTPERIRELTRRVREFFHFEKWCRIDFEVEPIKRQRLANKARLLRNGIVSEERRFPIDRFIELGLPACWPDLTFVVTPDEEMDFGANGKASLFPPFIEVSAKVYKDVADGGAWGSWILAHELGHVWLAHRDGLRGPIEKKTKLPNARSAEWQADEFAAELLMPEATCAEMSAEDIAETYGVSTWVAADRLRFISRRKTRSGRRPAVQR